MRIKLWYKEGYTGIIDTIRDYNRCKKSINECCGCLENYEREILQDLKTRDDIVRYELIL